MMQCVMEAGCYHGPRLVLKCNAERSPLKSWEVLGARTRSLEPSLHKIGAGPNMPPPEG